MFALLYEDVTKHFVVFTILWLSSTLLMNNCNVACLITYDFSNKFK